MAKQLSLLFALVLTGGCSAAHGDFETMCAGPLHATVTVEETGEVLADSDRARGTTANPSPPEETTGPG